MIGIIGPGDSVALALQVAAELGLGDRVLSRVYEHVEEVRSIARELDDACQVLLFTGRVPHALASRDKDLRAVLAFVPHGEIDLYRAISLALRDRGGRLPVMSIDTIERAAVDEVFLDLGTELPAEVLQLEIDENGNARSAADIAAFHIEAYRRGDVELCLTCLGAVRDWLVEAGVPVIRVEHTRASLREALNHAGLADRLARSQASQIAVAVVDTTKLRERMVAADGSIDDSRLGRDVRRQVEDLAARLHGTITTRDERYVTIHATRGALEPELQRLSSGRSRAGRSAASLPVGFGTGESTASAEQNARRALSFADERPGPHALFVDGISVQELGQPRLVHRLRETDGRTLARARSLGIGSLTLARLVAAMRQLDTESVTARDLALAYGVTSRSALRILGRLEKAGYASVLGLHVAPRAGRPQTVYRVDIDRLLPER